MAGTRLGGLKAAETNKQRHGSDFYKKIGKSGGTESRGGGWSMNGDPEHDEAIRAHAAAMGSIGGKMSRRGTSDKPRRPKVYKVPVEQFIEERANWVDRMVARLMHPNKVTK